MAASKKLRLPKKLVIDRSKWGRGLHGGRLLAGPNSYNVGRMCCLGFACLALGASSDQILGKAYPSEVGYLRSSLPKWLGSIGDSEAMKLARINDDRGTSDAQKERAIKRIFAKHGCRVTFVNGADK